MGIDLLAHTTAYSQLVPAPLRPLVVDFVFETLKFGDDVGGWFLDAFHAIVRQHVLP